jgi:chemotaxis protein MotA
MSDTARRFDPAALVGLVLAAVVVFGAHRMEGGVLQTLVQGAAALVVFGGTTAALLVSYPLSSLSHALQSVGRAFRTEPPPDRDLVARFAGYATRARRKGLFALEDEIAELEDPFLALAVELAVDGFPAADVRRTLESDSRNREQVDETDAEVFEAAAGYAPTLGILGAVLGLIHVMDNLAAPSRLGAGIAVAFVATVYGVGSANLLFMPLATKLRARARAAALSREVVIEGVSAIQAGVHPHLIERHLLTYVDVRARATGGERVA